MDRRTSLVGLASARLQMENRPSVQIRSWGVQATRHARARVWAHELTYAAVLILCSEEEKKCTKEKLTNIPSLLTHRSKHIDGVLQL